MDEICRDIIVMGASAGGIPALLQIAPALRADLAAAIFVVLHVPAQHTVRLHEVLARAGPVQAKLAEDREPLRKGCIYVAPADHHLLVRPGQLRLSHGPRENGSRPAIDATFRSAAVHYGTAVTGVVLSGWLDDGTAGLDAVRRCGGYAIVQDSRDAQAPDMPDNARAYAGADSILKASEIGQCLNRLVAEQAPPPVPIPTNLVNEDLAMGPDATTPWDQTVDKLGQPAGMSCPECGGPLWQVSEDEGLPRYRCLVGHSLSAKTLEHEQRLGTEQALWAAVRHFRERQRILGRLADAAERSGNDRAAAGYRARQKELEGHAAMILRVLGQDTPTPGEGKSPAA